MLHVERLTPTHRAAVDRRRAFFAKTAETAKKRIEVKQQPPTVQIVPVQYADSNDVFGPHHVPPAPPPIQSTDPDVVFGPRIYKKPRPAFDKIIKAASIYFRVSVTNILSERKDANFVNARHMTMYLCSTLTLYSLTRMGRLMHKNHTTIIHGIRRIQGLLAANDSYITKAYDDLIAELGEDE